jgi:hypothetical protein
LKKPKSQKEGWGPPPKTLIPHFPTTLMNSKAQVHTSFLPIHFQIEARNSPTMKKKKDINFSAIFLAENSCKKIASDVVKWTIAFGVQIFHCKGIFSAF